VKVQDLLEDEGQIMPNSILERPIALQRQLGLEQRWEISLLFIQHSVYRWKAATIDAHRRCEMLFLLLGKSDLAVFFFKSKNIFTSVMKYEINLDIAKNVTYTSMQNFKLKFFVV
jgi:hypothetical protein